MIHQIIYIIVIDLSLIHIWNLITNPNILIIDNGFTGLDIDTRKKVVDNLNNRNNKTTLVIISSMMEDIKNADKIYKLEKKALVEMNMEEEVYDCLLYTSKNSRECYNR